MLIFLHFFNLPKTDCERTIPQHYTYIGLDFVFSLSNDADDVELAKNGIHDQFLEDLNKGFLRTNLIRGDIEHNKIQTLSQTHETCVVITETPSVRPTELTENPSIKIPESSTSLLFQILLKSNKNASELSSCCRNEILVSLRQVLKNTINEISSKPIPNRTLYKSEKNGLHHSLRSRKIKDVKKNKRNLEDDRSDDGPQLYAVLLDQIIDQVGK